LSLNKCGYLKLWLANKAGTVHCCYVCVVEVLRTKKSLCHWS